MLRTFLLFTSAWTIIAIFLATFKWETFKKYSKHLLFALFTATLAFISTVLFVVTF